MTVTNSPIQKLLFFVAQDFEDSLVEIIERFVQDLSRSRDWSVAAPVFVNESADEVITLGGYLSIYSALPPHDLPTELDRRNLDEVKDLISGLRKLSQEQDIDFELMRAVIPLASVKGWRKTGPKEDEWDWFIDRDNGIGYIRLLQFQEETTDELRAAIGDMREAGLKGLILDLRFNPGETSKDDAERGAFADQLAALADAFVSDGFGVVHRVQASVVDPVKTHQSNFIGTLNVCEAMRLNGVRRGLFASSAAVYAGRRRPCWTSRLDRSARTPHRNGIAPPWRAWATSDSSAQARCGMSMRFIVEQ